ncbi:hypothetical protein BDF20DRAFT_837708 [Mycotypha africana]|uniref:uncharacterized protein n=1 Tax=Mycotypha africana TaxID=64632 RepID=UPI0023013E61|nr:uncharacterized protein BDF20DRAFT_837708 [Mycotypha africana]KAI8973810.1 hypothetical protein BDF20DRAFT_837708 [Mycotypha africana]
MIQNWRVIEPVNRSLRIPSVDSVIRFFLCLNKTSTAWISHLKKSHYNSLVKNNCHQQLPFKAHMVVSHVLGNYCDSQLKNKFLSKQHHVLKFQLDISCYARHNFLPWQEVEPDRFQANTCMQRIWTSYNYSGRILISLRVKLKIQEQRNLSYHEKSH